MHYLYLKVFVFHYFIIESMGRSLLLQMNLLLSEFGAKQNSTNISNNS